MRVGSCSCFVHSCVTQLFSEVYVCSVSTVKVATATASPRNEGSRPIAEWSKDKMIGMRHFWEKWSSLVSQPILQPKPAVWKNDKVEFKMDIEKLGLQIPGFSKHDRGAATLHVGS
ncbi:hypothetical protein BCV70DRAFT_19715 [Testicularia cyperi]|uniref:Uncharacterized protein n=1 Tax=Testicularia cyperi TaxID=1882483 RepID=A0A317Y056_9BASI|nr:hypothetical protein BCV70DRAFT_19715 [Testicularia cyperi]